MYCTKCGTRNEDSASTCVQCGNALRPASFGTPATPAAPSPVAPPQVPQQQYQPPIAQSYTQPAMPVGPSIPNYLVQAILVTIFCCLPFGIVSIIFAAQVNTKASVGDIQGALAASRQAKLWAWIAFGIGGGIILIYALLMMLGIAAGIAGNVH